MTISNPLQQSIYQVLIGDEALGGLVTGIYDRAIEGTQYPYIIFGNMATTDWSTVTTSGISEEFTIEVWSREGGRKETVSLMESVSTLLHDTNPGVTGYSLVSLRLRSSEIKLENDGWTYHGVLKFHALLQKN